MVLVSKIKTRFCSISFCILKLKLLALLLIICTVTYLSWSDSDACTKSELYYSTKFNKTSANYSKSVYLTKDVSCEIIHIGLVSVGTTTNLFFYTLLKSLYFHRVNPLHFHILVDNKSKLIIRTLFDTWSVVQVNYSLYDLSKFKSDVSWIRTHHYSGIYGLLKLILPDILPDYISKIVVLDTDIIFNGNILELWMFFNKFNKTQFLGLIENESDFYLSTRITHWPAIGRGYNTGIILYDVKRLRTFGWYDVWQQIAYTTALQYGSASLADQDVVNSVIAQYPSILFRIDCNWNIQLSDSTLSFQCYKNNSLKAIHWNSPRKLNVVNKDNGYFKSLYARYADLNGSLLKNVLNRCASVITQETFSNRKNPCKKFEERPFNKWRTLLFFRTFEKVNLDSDITLVTQFSYDRLYLLSELFAVWEGPMSLTLYATDQEFQEVILFLDNMSILKGRKNIAFHVVFKDGDYYPINLLRNIGLLHVSTSYVFLTDIDFLPSHNLYVILKQHIVRQQAMYNKALIVPAFETQKYKTILPKSKKELLALLEKKKIFTFRYDVWASGHAPTNYTKWKTATAPYQIKWEMDFEPYIVVMSNVSKFDERFMGFGWNKVSHTMELEAQGYTFIVLPDVFVVHKPHAPSNDIIKFRRSPTYRM